jgi:hypothetical protein
MDISTGHITENDNKILSSKIKNNPVIFYRYPHGYFITVDTLDTITTTKQKLKDFGYSNEFVNILTQARKHKCEYLLIDADGHNYSDIPSFDW